MGRKRKESDRWMPAKLYRGKSAYEYRPVRGICIRVCGLDASRPAVMRHFADVYERFHTESGTVASLVRDYLDSPQYAAKAVSTRKKYEEYWDALNPVFGHVDAKKVKPEHVRQYMDIKGKTAPKSANRHKTFLSTVFSWGYERGRVTINPCKGVRAFPEPHRERYVEDWEYQAVYDHASCQVKAAMEISYCCAARLGDILRLKKDQLGKDGVFIEQGKTGKKQIKRWTPRLRAAIALAQSVAGRVESMYVIQTNSGTPYTDGGFRRRWKDAQYSARESTAHALDFTFHDIKAKSISDYEGNKQAFSGHKTASQVAIYDRKTPIVDSHDFPTIQSDKNSK